MQNLSLFEMLRLGGGAAYLNFGLGLVIAALIVVGFILAARKKNVAAQGWWSWTVLLLGFVGAAAGFVGTLMGLANVSRAAAGACPCAGGEGCAGPGDVSVYAQGAFEVLCGVAFAVFTPLLALFGHALVGRASQGKN